MIIEKRKTTVKLDEGEKVVLSSAARILQEICKGMPEDTFWGRFRGETVFDLSELLEDASRSGIIDIDTESDD